MKRKLRIINHSIVLSGFIFLTVVSSFAQGDFTIVPGVRVGAITKNISEAQLKKIYGSKNVKSDTIGLGEGETSPGTVIFPNDPKKRIEIVWKNKELKKSPEFIQMYGLKSVWRTKEGIGLGTSLKELVRINGREFTLAGFEWDYGGVVYSWRTGKLAKTFGNKGEIVTLMLNPREYEKVSEKDLTSVLGDGEFSSGNRTMRKINLVVHFMTINFP